VYALGQKRERLRTLINYFIVFFLPLLKSRNNRQQLTEKIEYVRKSRRLLIKGRVALGVDHLPVEEN